MVRALFKQIPVGVYAIVFFAAAIVSLVSFQQKVSAACAALDTSNGTVTSTVTIPTTGSYRVWSRIMAPDTTNNSYYLQIDDTTCGVNVGDSAITANTWTWVDYQSGTATNKINVTLTAGTHTVTMIGKEPGVKLDRVILTADTTCVPTGTGDNCASPPDTTAPVVAVTAPANNTTLNTTTSMTATATDDVAVAKVEFLVDGAVKGQSTTAPYSYSLNPTTLSAGSHTLTARATDTSGNITTSASVTVTVPDTTAPTVSVTAPTAASTISGTTTMTANAADNVAVSKVEFYVDGTLKGTDTTAPYSISLDTSALTNAVHSFTAKAFDAANNSTTSTAISATVNNTAQGTDTTKPVVAITSPLAGGTVSGNAYAVAATATDNVGVTKVEFYVDGTLKNTDNAAPFTFNLDSTTLTNGTHSFTAKAFDAAGNNTTSAAISATVNNASGSVRAEDIDQNGVVDIRDFSLLAAKFGQSGSSLGRADINGDGTVNILDFSRLASQFGK